MRSISATNARADLMAIIDEVSSTGETVEITKRGHPLVRITPAPRPDNSTLGGSILCSPEELVAFQTEWSEHETSVGDGFSTD
jgi:prevent-host-death family protein